MERSFFKKRLALMLCIIMLIGLLPLHATATLAEGVSILGVKDATGVTATLSNPTDENVDAFLILAVYEQDGKLVYFKQNQVTAAAGLSANQRFDYNVYENGEYTYKLYAWDISYIPLCADVSIEHIPALCVTVDGSDAESDGFYVTAAPEVTEFMYVKVDTVKKIGTAYKASKSGNIWTHAKVPGANVIITYKPESVIGGALPTAKLTYLDTRVSNNANKIRIVISL